MGNAPILDLIARLFRLVELHSHEFAYQPTENRPMQNYTNSSTSGFSIAVAMDVHKKTIVLCVYNAYRGEQVSLPVFLYY